ncbi:MAG: metallophosphoesterase [bacterium]|nr:metallophosphoesterase [bacterium]
MRFGWLSDIHLEFLDRDAIDAFIVKLRRHDVDAWLVTGDIGVASSLTDHLRRFDASLAVPVCFTLGNHDHYGGSVVDVEREMRACVATASRLVWLAGSEPTVMGGKVAIVGDDTWADARYGNARATPVLLNDFFRIADLKGLDRAALLKTLAHLADAAVARLEARLRAAAGMCPEVVVLTHVPPFREAAWHEGRPSDDDWVPWFACRALGEAILRVAHGHPEVSFLVLCGHTHGEGEYRPAANVTVLTAAAEYGAPEVQRILEIGS